MFGKKKDQEKQSILHENLKEYTDKIEQQNEDLKNLSGKIKTLEKMLKDKDFLIENLKKEQDQIQEQIKNNKLNDKGYQTLLGFKLIPPYLDKVIGRPFTITVSEEFNYKTASDHEKLDERKAAIEKSEGPGFHTFRDEFRPNCSMRVTYFFSSKDYYMNTSQGKIKMSAFILPDELEAGVEISSQFKSAMYLCIHNRALQSAVLPETIFGAPLLSYAFPILDEKGTPIGGVSFSNDISKIVTVAKGLGEAAKNQDDKILSRLASVLKEELYFSESASKKLKEEAVFSQKISEMIRASGQEIIQISERLKVLALNTAIESTKVGEGGKGVGIIAKQMKNISEVTGKSLRDISTQSHQLSHSSQKVFETSELLEKSSMKLKEESAVLLQTSSNINIQRDELAELVKVSLGEITQSKDDLKAIFNMIHTEQKPKN